MAFQRFNPFTHKTVANNVSLALHKLRKMPKDQTRAKVLEHLDMVEVGFSRNVSDSVTFMDDSVVVETAPPEQIFTDPQTPKLRGFLSAQRRFSACIQALSAEFRGARRRRLLPRLSGVLSDSQSIFPAMAGRAGLARRMCRTTITMFTNTSQPPLRLSDLRKGPVPS